MKRIALTLAAILVSTPLAFAQTAAAPSAPAAAPAAAIDGVTAFKTECSACHMAFQPQFLPAASWEAMMGGLKNHFGEDASLDDQTVAAIKDYLVANAGDAGKDATDANGAPVLRITQRSWFIRSHSREVSAKAMKRAGTMSNCVACHVAAEKGVFGDD